MNRIHETVSHYLIGGLAESTKRQYTKIQNKFVGFCQALGVSPCPSQAETILSFLAWAKLESGSNGGVNAQLAAIRNLHLINGFHPKAMGDPRIQLMRLGMNKQAKKKDSREPMSCSLLYQIKATLSPNCPDDILFFAALTTGFYGMLRIGEMAASAVNEPPVRVEGIKWIADRVEIPIQWSKTDIEGRGTTIILPTTGTEICP